MDCYTRYSMNILYEEARKCYVNATSSKALGVKITPEYVGPLPSNKRERHPRKCKKEAFNYKTNTMLPPVKLSQFRTWDLCDVEVFPFNPWHRSLEKTPPCDQCDKWSDCECYSQYRSSKKEDNSYPHSPCEECGKYADCECFYLYHPSKKE